jgi:phage/plasmid-associated DNA primase
MAHPDHGCGYDPIGDCPLWKRFLDTTFEGDKELISYVQGLFGYAAMGEVLSHILPFFWGAGQNGKTCPSGSGQIRAR